MKKLWVWFMEIALVGGLLWTGCYALAAVVVWLVVWLYFIAKRVDYLRAQVRVYQVANEVKVMAIADAVGVTREALERHSLDLERDPSAWASLKRDADAVGVTLQTVAETRARLASEPLDG